MGGMLGSPQGERTGGLARPLPSGVLHRMAKCSAPRTAGKLSLRSLWPTASSSGRLPPSAIMYGRAVRAEPFIIPPMGGATWDRVGISFEGNALNRNHREHSVDATRSISPLPPLPARNGQRRRRPALAESTLRPKIETRKSKSQLADAVARTPALRVRGSCLRARQKTPTYKTGPPLHCAHPQEEPQTSPAEVSATRAPNRHLPLGV